MGWFDEQIRQRTLSDQELFEESIYQMASVVLGKQRPGVLDERIITKKALDDILKYYRAKPVEIPSTVRDAEEALEYCLRPHGIMRRNVRLEDGWYRDAFGPMIASAGRTGRPSPSSPRFTATGSGTGRAAKSAASTRRPPRSLTGTRSASTVRCRSKSSASRTLSSISRTASMSTTM